MQHSPPVSAKLSKVVEGQTEKKEESKKEKGKKMLYRISNWQLYLFDEIDEILILATLICHDEQFAKKHIFETFVFNLQWIHVMQV